MFPIVIDARHTAGYRVWLRFSDGLTGEVDLSYELWGPAFEPLKAISEFAQLDADPESGTIVWPNGAQLPSDYLYGELLNAIEPHRGRVLPQFGDTPTGETADASLEIQQW